MNLWKLEWLRMTRSSKAIALIGVFVFFGILGPLSAAYIGEIVEQFGGGVEIIFPPPTAADGVTQYVGNVQQIGLLVLVLIAAGALTMEARFEMAVFLRTRVQETWRLLLPRFVVVAGAGVVAFTVGWAVAWYETAVLIENPDAGSMLAVLGFASAYLVFAVSVVAFAGTHLKAILPSVMLSLGILLLVPLLALFPPVADWLPSHLLGASNDLLRGGDASEYLRSLLMTVALSGGFLALSVRGLARREL
jgi:ABC-2 type transport system permease protein